MSTVPSLDDYRLAHDRLLESLWLAAVDLDLPFAVHVAQVAEPMWLISYTDRIHRPAPTEHVFACWIESEAHHLAAADGDRPF